MTEPFPHIHTPGQIRTGHYLFSGIEIIETFTLMVNMTRHVLTYTESYFFITSNERLYTVLNCMHGISETASTVYGKSIDKDTIVFINTKADVL